MLCSFIFFFNDTATTEIYTLSLHDALPISLCIAGVALLGWQVMGLAPAAALLLGAALAPTDPVLASDVQVGGPTTEQEIGEGTDEIDEADEVRFSLTSEAGLNDGLEIGRASCRERV